MTSSIVLRATGIVYRNPRPNVRSLQAFFPSVVEIQPGEILVSFDRGSAMENNDVRSFLTRSIDNGESWSEPEKLYEPENPFDLVSTSFRMSRTLEGELLGLFTLFHRSHPDEGLANPETNGFVRTEFMLTRSGDGGRTWTDPVSLLLPIDWGAFETCSPILPVDRDRYLLPTSLWKNWFGEAPLGMKAVTIQSRDAGETWTRAVTVMDSWAAGVVHWEQKQALLPEGRILAVCWTHDLASGRTLKNRYAFSNDHGDSFGPVHQAPLWGETCTPLALGDGRVLLLYRHAEENGLWANLCRFEGEDWIPMEDIPLWGAGQAAYGSDSEKTFEKLAALRFGYPQLVRLADGEVFAVLWCVEEGAANIRWLRLKID